MIYAKHNEIYLIKQSSPNTKITFQEGGFVLKLCHAGGATGKGGMVLREVVERKGER